MGRPCFVALALAAGCSGAAPERAAALFHHADQRLGEVEQAAGRYAGQVSPGARAALGLRALLLGTLRPGGRRPTPPPGDPFGGSGDDAWDLLQPELVDAGVAYPGGGHARFPEVQIGGGPSAGPPDIDVDLGGGGPSGCSAAVVGVYHSLGQGGWTLLVLDAGGGYAVEDGGRRQSGRYRCADRRILLDAAARGAALRLGADESLMDGDGRRYRPLGGPS